MQYEIELLPAAVRELASLPVQLRSCLTRRIALLRSDPHPPDEETVHGWANLHRVRERDQRVIYIIDATTKRLTVVLLGQDVRRQPALLRQLDDIMSIVGEAEPLRRLAADELEDAADAHDSRAALAAAGLIEPMMGH